jgi:ubiquinone/menaquinone biosynthesis C-methylase UbiE
MHAGAPVSWRKITEELQHSLMLRLIENVGDKQILDIGCGDGKLAVELAQRGANVIGIDASKDMIDAARHHADGRGVHVDLRVASAQSLPFPEAEFDVVVAVTILCFVEDATPAFAEITRVLKPGSRLVIVELSKWSTWAAERRVRAWLGSTLWKRGRFRTPRELRASPRGAQVSNRGGSSVRTSTRDPPALLV